MDFIYEKLLKRFKNGDKVVIAVSGGPDSMALLHLMVRIKSKMDITVICTHINHNVRKSSESEAKFIQKYCLDNNIVFEMHKIEKYSKDNFHNEARNIRYDFLKKIINKYEAKYLLTAHHADDLMESILMRIVRGSTLKGYAGFEEEINKIDYTILRPLILVNKKDILNYLKKNQLKYVTDKSNFKDKYTRNRYRKYVIPFLKKEASDVEAKFYSFSQKILESDNYIEKFAKLKYRDIVINFVIDLTLFNKEDLVIQKRLLSIYLENIYGNDLSLINDKNLDDLIKLCHSKKASLSLNLPSQIKIVKSYDKVMIDKTSSEYSYILEDTLTLPNEKTLSFTKESNLKSNYVTRLLSDEIKLPLIVRNRKNADKMFVKGLKGTKKINDIFIDSKVSIRERNGWPIVTDSNGKVVWLPGLKKSQFDKSKDENHDIILKYH